MKNFAALLATIASVHAVKLGAEAEAEAQFGIESFFKSDEMIPQFLGSGMFPTEDVPSSVDDVIDSADEKIIDEAEADEDEDVDEDEDEDE